MSQALLAAPATLQAPSIAYHALMPIFIVVGAANSSNSQRLREVAEREGCRISLLVPSVDALDFSILEGVASVAVSAGASAPEILVEQILDGLAERYTLEVETLTTREENMFFPLPRTLREPAPAAT